MPMKTTYTDYWVKVQIDKGIPNKDPDVEHKQNLRACEDMKSQIRRHVDVDYIETDVDVEKVCSYCGSMWTKGDESSHNGGCCADDANHLYMDQVAEALRVMKLIAAQDQGAGGNTTPEEAWKSAKRLAEAAVTYLEN